MKKISGLALIVFFIAIANKAEAIPASEATAIFDWDELSVTGPIEWTIKSTRTLTNVQNDYGSVYIAKLEQPFGWVDSINTVSANQVMAIAMTTDTDFYSMAQTGSYDGQYISYFADANTSRRSFFTYMGLTSGDVTISIPYHLSYSFGMPVAGFVSQAHAVVGMYLDTKSYELTSGIYQMISSATDVDGIILPFNYSKDGVLSYSRAYNPGDVGFFQVSAVAGGQTWFENNSPSVTPEPVSSLLFIFGLGALGPRRLLRKKIGEDGEILNKTFYINI